MNLWLLLVLMIFASFRLTVLVVFDTFPPIQWARTKIQHARPFVLRHQDVHQDGRIYPGEIQEYWWLGELVGCAWCASAYVSGAVVAITWAVYGMPAPLLVWLAVWGGAAWLASTKKTD